MEVSRQPTDLKLQDAEKSFVRAQCARWRIVSQVAREPGFAGTTRIAACSWQRQTRLFTIRIVPDIDANRERRSARKLYAKLMRFYVSRDDISRSILSRWNIYIFLIFTISCLPFIFHRVPIIRAIALQRAQLESSTSDDDRSRSLPDAERVWQLCHCQRQVANRNGTRTVATLSLRADRIAR